MAVLVVVVVVVVVVGLALVRLAACGSDCLRDVGPDGARRGHFAFRRVHEQACRGERGVRQRNERTALFFFLPFISLSIVLSPDLFFPSPPCRFLFFISGTQSCSHTNWIWGQPCDLPAAKSFT